MDRDVLPQPIQEQEVTIPESASSLHIRHSLLETRLHNKIKHGCPQGPLCTSLLSQMNQLLELLVMVEHEREFIRELFLLVSNVL